MKVDHFLLKVMTLKIQYNGQFRGPTWQCHKTDGLCKLLQLSYDHPATWESVSLLEHLLSFSAVHAYYHQFLTLISLSSFNGFYMKTSKVPKH